MYKEEQFSSHKHQITNKCQALNPKFQNEMYVPLCLQFEVRYEICLRFDACFSFCALVSLWLTVTVNLSKM
jgi:hypothetical protein